MCHLKPIYDLICRWTQVGYAEMGGVGNEEEAAARMSAALGLPSYPLPVNETLRLCTWVKSRPASSGYLGEQAFLQPRMKSQHTPSHVLLYSHNSCTCIYVHILQVSLRVLLPGQSKFMYMLIHLQIYSVCIYM